METRNRISLLAVDDNPHNLLSLEGLVAGLGVDVVKASSGEDALRRVLERDFAVVLLDIHMPDMDGFETARLIRSRPRTERTPIIFLTAYAHDDEKVRRGYDLGAVDFLFKPLVPEILRSKVSVFVDLHRKSDEILRQSELLRQAAEREHEQHLAEARAAWERQALQSRMERERRSAEFIGRKADELARTVREKERAESALRESLARIELLATTAETLLSAETGREAADSVVQALGERLSLDLGWVYFEDAPASPYVWNRPKTEHPPVLADAAAGDPLAVGDVGARTGMQTVFSHRLESHGRRLGSVVFGRRPEGGFTGHERAVLRTVAEQLAMALDRLVLVRSLQGHAQQLEEADRRKNDFMAMLGHELRNPLAPIVNALALVSRHPKAEPALIPSIEAAQRQARHMARLVDDLLDVSRITQGKVVLRRERVGLKEVVDQAIHTASPLIEARKQMLQASLPSGPVTLDADPTRLAQVFANLLNNASKYSDEGARIELRVRAEGSGLVVEVQDEGVGMPPDRLEQVFETFMQIDPTADRARGGLGLGLSLVRSLVELHGGTASAFSAGPGLGTTVTVSVPVVVQDEADPVSEDGAEAAGLPQPLVGAARRVLVVEDNEDIRITLRDLLEIEGHQVWEAPDGESGAAAILERRPDLALVDIGLPGLDGMELARRVRARLDGSVRLVALTGYGGSEVSERIRASGFDAHLVKPVRVEQLLELLATLP